LAAALASALLLALPASAAASQPALVTRQHTPPRGFRLTAAEVKQIALTNPVIRAEVRRHPDANVYEYTLGPGQWQVSWFSAPRNRKELALAYVDDATGKVTQAWTGFQVAWSMARGYPGAFGRLVNAVYIWLPLCALVLVPFIPWRRLRDRGSWSLLHLDLAMLLGLSISLAFFNHAKIGLSVPLVYPFLLYLLVRLLLLAFGRGRPRRSLELSVPVRWLLVATLALIGFRIALNVINSNVIDVGYAGVIGSHRLLHGHTLYGTWPSDNSNGNTYGPATVTHHLTLYRALSGALVFGAGTVQWAWGLDVNHDTQPDVGPTSPDVRMQQATVNLFADMGVQPATLISGLVGASRSTDTAAPTSRVTVPTAGTTLTSGSPTTISGTEIALAMRCQRSMPPTAAPMAGPSARRR